MRRRSGEASYRGCFGPSVIGAASPPYDIFFERHSLVSVAAQRVRGLEHMIRAYIIHHFTTYMHWIMYSTVQALNNVLNVAIGESHLDQVACEFFSHPPSPKLTEGGLVRHTT